MKKDINYLLGVISELELQLKEKDKAIDKAIQYIEDNKEYTLIEKSSNQDFKGIPTFYYINEDILNAEMIKELLEILKGSDKE